MHPDSLSDGTGPHAGFSSGGAAEAEAVRQRLAEAVVSLTSLLRMLIIAMDEGVRLSDLHAGELQLLMEAMPPEAAPAPELLAQAFQWQCNHQHLLTDGRAVIV